MSVTNSALDNIFSKVPSNQIIECSLCNNQNKNIKFIYCNVGDHHVHFKCIGIKPNNVKNLNLKNWSCDDCSPFPFNNIDNNYKLSESFN